MQAGLGRDVLGRESRTAVGWTSERVRYGQNWRKAKRWDRAEKDGAVK